MFIQISTDEVAYFWTGINLKNNNKPVKSCKLIDQSDYRRLKMHEIERTAGGFVAGKICENTQQNGRARLCRWSEYVSHGWESHGGGGRLGIKKLN